MGTHAALAHVFAGELELIAHLEPSPRGEMAPPDSLWPRPSLPRQVSAHTLGAVGGVPGNHPERLQLSISTVRAKEAADGQVRTEA